MILNNYNYLSNMAYIPYRIYMIYIIDQNGLVVLVITISNNSNNVLLLEHFLFVQKKIKNKN